MVEKGCLKDAWDLEESRTTNQAREPLKIRKKDKKKSFALYRKKHEKAVFAGNKLFRVGFCREWQLSNCCQTALVGKCKKKNRFLGPSTILQVTVRRR